MPGKVVDLGLVFFFLRQFVKPFNKWEAFKHGIIDEKGKVLRKRKTLKTTEEKRSFGLYDVLILNMKKMLALIPGGGSRLGTFSAALLLLLKEDQLEEFEDNEELLKESLIEIMATQTKPTLGMLREFPGDSKRGTRAKSMSKSDLDKAMKEFDHGPWYLVSKAGAKGRILKKFKNRKDAMDHRDTKGKKGIYMPQQEFDIHSQNEDIEMDEGGKFAMPDDERELVTKDGKMTITVRQMRGLFRGGALSSGGKAIRGGETLTTDSRKATINRLIKTLKLEDTEMDETAANVLKKVGRRKAGSYGRPGSKKQKRAASKGVRKTGKPTLKQVREAGKKPKPEKGMTKKAGRAFVKGAKGVKIKHMSERDYKREYEDYHGKPDQIKRRTGRNAARRLMAAKAPIKKDHDIHHKDNNPTNNDPSNLAVQHQSVNRAEPRLRGVTTEGREFGKGTTGKRAALKHRDAANKKAGDRFAFVVGKHPDGSYATYAWEVFSRSAPTGTKEVHEETQMQTLTQLREASVDQKFAFSKLGLKDRKVIFSFLEKRKDNGGKKLNTDGKQIDILGMGGSKVAFWKGGKVVWGDSSSRSRAVLRKTIMKIADMEMMNGVFGENVEEVRTHRPRSGGGAEGKRIEQRIKRFMEISQKYQDQGMGRQQADKKAMKDVMKEDAPANMAADGANVAGLDENPPGKKKKKKVYEKKKKVYDGRKIVGAKAGLEEGDKFRKITAQMTKMIKQGKSNEEIIKKLGAKAPSAEARRQSAFIDTIRKRVTNESVDEGLRSQAAIDQKPGHPGPEPRRPRGAAHIENIHFWGKTRDALKFVIKDAGEAIRANPENPKNFNGPRNYADQINDAGTVLMWRKKKGIKEGFGASSAYALIDKDKKIIAKGSKKAMKMRQKKDKTTTVVLSPSKKVGDMILGIGEEIEELKTPPYVKDIVHRHRGKKKKVKESDETFMGCKVFDVSLDEFVKCTRGKVPQHRYSKYAESEKIREYGRANPGKGIIVRDDRTHAMMYLKRPKGE